MTYHIGQYVRFLYPIRTGGEFTVFGGVIRAIDEQREIYTVELDRMGYITHRTRFLQIEVHHIL